MRIKKSVEICFFTIAAAKKSLYLRIEACCGAKAYPEKFVQNFDIVIKPFRDDWRDACEIYRQRIVSDTSVKKAEKPAWTKDSPVAIIYSVCGDAELGDKTNVFVHYENIPSLCWRSFRGISTVV